MQLRDRLRVAVHGHSLLKDKLEGLMAEFMELVEEYADERQKFNEEYPAVARLFVFAGIAGSRESIDDALSQTSGDLELRVSTENVLSVQVPHFEAEAHPGGGYSLLDTPLELDEATETMAEFLPRILELAEKEHTIWELMDEIERTRRRVNALEYIMIPQLRETVKYIQRKLDENERANITRLMKIKEMRLEEEREAAKEEGRSVSSV